MTLEPAAVSTSELAFRALGHTGKWLVLLVTGAGNAPKAAEALREDIESMDEDSDEAPAVVSAAGGPLALATSFEDTPPGALLVCDLDAFTGEDWAKVDLLRSRYRRDHAVILAMTEDSMSTLMRRAPNLASWIRECFHWDEAADSLSDAERPKTLYLSLREMLVEPLAHPRRVQLRDPVSGLGGARVHPVRPQRARARQRRSRTALARAPRRRRPAGPVAADESIRGARAAALRPAQTRQAAAQGPRVAARRQGRAGRRVSRAGAGRCRCAGCSAGWRSRRRR